MKRNVRYVMLGIATMHLCVLLHLFLSGSLERAGAYPSYHRARDGVHPKHSV